MWTVGLAVPSQHLPEGTESRWHCGEVCVSMHMCLLGPLYMRGFLYVQLQQAWKAFSAHLGGGPHGYPVWLSHA